jgi:hypothetical protein
MRGGHVRRFAPQLFAQLFCISLVLFSFSASQGQTRPIPQRQVQNRHVPLDSLRHQPRIQPHPRERLQALVSLRNDFRQLQIVNNNLMLRVFDPGPTQKITNKEIRSSLGEIKKRAERVGYSFGIPKIKAKPETDVALAVGLRQLDKAVISFVHNPLFQQSRIYDAELASRAAKELSDVLRLAEALRRLTK